MNFLGLLFFKLLILLRPTHFSRFLFLGQTLCDHLEIFLIFLSTRVVWERLEVIIGYVDLWILN